MGWRLGRRLGTTDASVVGACAEPYDFGGARACKAYVIQTDDDGECYPIKATVLRKLPTIA